MSLAVQTYFQRSVLDAKFLRDFINFTLTANLKSNSAPGKQPFPFIRLAFAGQQFIAGRREDACQLFLSDILFGQNDRFPPCMGRTNLFYPECPTYGIIHMAFAHTAPVSYTHLRCRYPHRQGQCSCRPHNNSTPGVSGWPPVSFAPMSCGKGNRPACVPAAASRCV